MFRSSSTQYVPAMRARMSCILTIVATVVVLVAGDCIQNITLLPSGGVVPQYTSGYYHIGEKDPIVKQIVADSVKFYNDGINQDIHFIDGDNYVAYRKVEKNDLAYCCQFHMLGRVCEEFDETSTCQYKNKHVCSVEAHQAFFTQYATINIKSLHCLGVHKPR